MKSLVISIATHKDIENALHAFVLDELESVDDMGDLLIADYSKVLPTSKQWLFIH